MTGALAAVLERIRSEGPLSFETYLDLALYGDGGFFTAGGGAGRRADFITSPELGPLFGTVVAAALDDEWARLGRPDRFVVVEGGAGRGELARAVVDAGPVCLPALHYVCVERSPALRAAAADLLPIEPPANALTPGPVVTVLDDLPAEPVTGVVLANELLDNLPFTLLERTGDSWSEVCVGEAAVGGGLVEVLVPAREGDAAEAGALVPGPSPGARIPLQHRAVDWLRSALERLDAGRVVVVDYADTTASLAGRPWTEWVRTYRAHGRGAGPLDDPGHQDVTCEVAVDQLARARRPVADTAQADWLRQHGIDDRVAAARDDWQARAHVGDLEAIRARSRVGEADALTDRSGLGAFRVVEWEV